MYCQSCGTFNDDNNFRCIQCGTVLQTAAGPAGGGMQGGYNAGGYGAETWPEPSKADTAIIFAVLGWVICGLFCIPAFVIARDEIRGIEMGNRNPNKKGTAKAAYWLSVIQFVLLAIVIFFVVIAIGIGGFA